MEQITTILINSNTKLVQEVSIPNFVNPTVLFKAIYKLIDINSNDDFDNCANLYDEDATFHKGYHNIYQKRFYENSERVYIKTNNPKIFITKPRSKILYLRGKILIIGEVIIREEQIVRINPLKFSIEEVLKSIEWGYDNTDYNYKMTKSEKQAEIEEILRNIQGNGFY